MIIFLVALYYCDDREIDSAWESTDDAQVRAEQIRKENPNQEVAVEPIILNAVVAQ